TTLFRSSHGRALRPLVPFRIAPRPVSLSIGFAPPRDLPLIEERPMRAMALDFSVAARQAFGTSVSEPAVRKLLSGRLAMRPHPEWTLPPEIDWAADPFQDVNWRSQYHMLRWLDPLRRAAAKGDDAAFSMWLRYVRDWVRSNPRDDPAHEWVWSDMVDGIRAIQLCLAAPLVRDKSPEDLGWLEQTIVDHAEFMADP